MKLANCVIVAAVLTGSGEAAAADRAVLAVPAGTLGTAVIALGRQANVSIGISDPALARLRVPGVSGRLSPAEALRRLLRGSPARVEAIDARTFRIVAAPRPAPRVARRPVPRPAAPPNQSITEAGPDIVVTALKRPFRLRDVPAAIGLVTADDPVLQDGLRGSDALLARLHTVTSTHYGPGRNKLFLRGIADSSFNGPTQATVGQYLGETRLNYNAPDPDLRLYDIDRVEVLPGPQGTLYGAGSLGGIIRTVPNAPRLGESEAALALGLSTTRHGEAGTDGAGMLNLPVVEDRLALRLVGYGAMQGGYIDDTLRGRRNINDTRIHGGRAALAADLGDGWRATASATGQRIRGDDAQFADRDQPPLTRRSPLAQPFSNDYLLGDFVVTRDWGEYRLVSATGFVRQSLRERYDSTVFDGPPTLFDQRTRIRLFTSELRLSRQLDGGGGWLIGASLVDNSTRQNRQLGVPGRPEPIPGAGNDVFEATLFGEASLRLTDWLTATAGTRVAQTRVTGRALDPISFPEFNRGLTDRRERTTVLPSAALVARSGDWLGFLRYQEGFRPGGVVASQTFIDAYASDRVRTVELGFRTGAAPSDRFDGQLALSWTRWSDIQADTVDFSGFPTTANIGDGRIWTVDARLGWRPLPGLRLEAAGLFNDSLVNNPLPSIILTPRAPLPNVARWNARASAEYRTELGDDAALRLSAGARYVGKSRLGIGAILGQPQGDWLDLHAGARIERGRYAVSLSATNLLDTAGNRFALGSPFTLVDNPQVTPLVPRTIRLGWELRF